MIIKSTSYKKTKAFFNLPNYLLRNNELKPIHCRFVLGENYDPKTLSQQFSFNEQFRKHKRSNSVHLIMDVLSFDKRSTSFLNNTKLKQIAKKYIALRAPRAICIVVAHQDKSHTHLHILFSAIEYRSGKSIRISKEQFKTIKLEMEEFQREKFPELYHSSINHNPSYDKKRKLNLTQSEQQILNRGSISEKQSIATALEEAYRKATSKEDFFELAKVMNLNLYSRSGQIVGVLASRKYRFKTLGYSPEIIELLEQNLNKNKRLEILKTIKKNYQEHEKNLFR